MLKAKPDWDRSANDWEEPEAACIDVSFRELDVKGSRVQDPAPPRRTPGYGRWKGKYLGPCTWVESLNSVPHPWLPSIQVLASVVFLKMCLFEKYSYWARRRHGERKPSSNHLLTPTNDYNGQVKAIWVSHLCCRGPNFWAKSCCFLRRISRELDQ